MPLRLHKLCNTVGVPAVGGKINEARSTHGRRALLRKRAITNTTYKDTNQEEWWVPMSDCLKFEFAQAERQGNRIRVCRLDGVKDPKTAFEAAR